MKLLARRSRTLGRAVAVTAVAGLLAGGVVSAGASATGARPTTADVRLVSAAGVRQSLNCQGSGPFTVIVVTGLHSTALDWSKVAHDFRAVTRTCFYDRPGLGLSPARPNHVQILNAGIYANELAALLKAAHEPGPYVVVGHSMGGLIARTFVRRNLSAIRAVLLAESVDPSDKTTGKYWYEAGHAVDLPASQSATGGGPNIGARPLLVLSASHPEEDHLGGPTYGQPAWMIKQWIAQQRADVRLSTNSIQVIAKSGHVLQQDNPRAVVAALKALVHATQTHTRLTCTSVWTDVSAACRKP